MSILAARCADFLPTKLSVSYEGDKIEANGALLNLTLEMQITKHLINSCGSKVVDEPSKSRVKIQDKDALLESDAEGNGGDVMILQEKGRERMVRAY